MYVLIRFPFQSKSKAFVHNSYHTYIHTEDKQLVIVNNYMIIDRTFSPEPTYGATFDLVYFNLSSPYDI